MSLQDWLKNGWLADHKTSPDEIADLLSVIDRDLNDCQTSSISPDWRLSIAYNAALQVAVAGLAAMGYRPGREAHHYRTIQSLAYTLRTDSTTIAQLDAFRKKRNISDYERAGSVTDIEANEMISLALKLRKELLQWLKKEHPEFMPEGQ
ncbi:MAG TPA: hypothetical protein VIH42_13320 [Thermoguttaceae bacterium]